MSTIFDLEQELLNFSNITSDIELIENEEDIKAIKRIYDKKFDKVWKLFEDHCLEIRNLKNTI